MKTFTNLYKEVCKFENIRFAYLKARKGKTKTKAVMEFEINLDHNLKQLEKELISGTYFPSPLNRFVIRDPKTRVIHSSIFRDRIVHHLIVMILSPIYEPRFIYDSFAGRKNKGVHKAISRFDYFKRKVSSNGNLIKGELGNISNNYVQGYVLKCDIFHYFDTIDHNILLSILKRRIKDDTLINLINKVLKNFSISEGKGMPLGNYTSQFFANVYLNEVDYFIKNSLKAKYYLRYMDDFVILHKSKKRLEYCKIKIIKYIQCLKIQLHPNKSKIISLSKGVNLLGYKIFFYYKIPKKSNLNRIIFSVKSLTSKLENESISVNQVSQKMNGFLGYLKWTNSFKLRLNLFDYIYYSILLNNKLSEI